jgi:mannose-6-phosphate isomerase-like protein (cupin superfamily)
LANKALSASLKKDGAERFPMPAGREEGLKDDRGTRFQLSKKCEPSLAQQTDREAMMVEAPEFLAETETTVPIVQPPGSGKVVGVLRDQSTFKVLPEQTRGAYAILEQKIPAGHGPPLHVHRHETEIFYILEGQFEVVIGGQTVPASPGALVVGPRNIPHTFRNVGSDVGRLLLTVIPGRFANYFIEVDGVADDDHAAIRALLAKYEVELV